MRILVAHDVPREHIGGMNRMMRFSHQWIADEGHEVVYFSSEDVPLQHRLFRRFQFPWAVYQAAIAAFRQGRPFDIVNVHEPHSAAMAWLRKNAGNPQVVVTSHGSEHRGWELAKEEARLGRTGPTILNRFLNPSTRLWQCKAGLTRADHVFCLNEEDRRYFETRLGLSPEKITRLTPGATDIYGNSNAERLALRQRGSSFRGHGTRIRGSRTWLDFHFPGERERGFNANHCWRRGAGKHFEARVSADVRERVSLIQTNGDAENALLLEQADIFILPSIFEGTPLSLMEAMASALPVVTTDTCGMRDVIQNGKNGLLVPMRSPESIAESVRRLVNDADCESELAARAQKDTAEKYTWARSGRTILRAYEGLLDKDREWIRKVWPVASKNERPLKFSFVADFSPEWNAGAAGSILAIGAELEGIGHSVRHCWKERTLTSGINFNVGQFLELPRIQLRQVKEEMLGTRPDVVVISQPFAYGVFESLAKKYPETLFLNLTHGWEHRNDIANRTFGWGDDFSGIGGLKRRIAMAARARACRRTALALDGLLAPCSAEGRFVDRTYGAPAERILLFSYGLEEDLMADLPSRSARPGLRMVVLAMHSEKRKHAVGANPAGDRTRVSRDGNYLHCARNPLATDRNGLSDELR